MRGQELFQKAGLLVGRIDFVPLAEVVEGPGGQGRIADSMAKSRAASSIRGGSGLDMANSSFEYPSSNSDPSARKYHLSTGLQLLDTLVRID